MDLSELSDGLFGRPMRLPLLMWIRHRQLFYITEACKSTGFEHGHVVKELDTFVSLGLLVRLPVERKNDRQYFQRNDACPFWRFADLGFELLARGDVEETSELRALEPRPPGVTGSPVPGEA